MPLYHATIPGRRKPLLIKADNATKAFASLVDLKALTAAEKDDALERGEKIWKPGDDLPEDDPAPDASAVQQDQAEAQE